MYVLLRKSTGEYLAKSHGKQAPVIIRKETDPEPEIEWIEWHDELPEDIDDDFVSRDEDGKSLYKVDKEKNKLVKKVKK